MEIPKLPVSLVQLGVVKYRLIPSAYHMDNGSIIMTRHLSLPIQYTSTDVNIPIVDQGWRGWMEYFDVIPLNSWVFKTISEYHLNQVKSRKVLLTV